jgi:peroxiredoxin
MIPLLLAQLSFSNPYSNFSSQRNTITEAQHETSQSKEFILLGVDSIMPRSMELQLRHDAQPQDPNSFSKALQISSKDFVLIDNTTAFAPYCTALQLQSKEFVLVGNATVYSTALQVQSKAFVVMENSHTHEYCTAVQLQSKKFVLLENATSFAPYCTALQVSSRDFVLIDNTTAFAPYCTALQLQSNQVKTQTVILARKFSTALQRQSKAFVLKGVTAMMPRVTERGLVRVAQHPHVCYDYDGYRFTSTESNSA